MIHKIWRLVKVPRMNKQEAIKILSDVPEDKVFWVNDGRVLRNLYDLSAALAEMSKETFKYHVNKDKNDFKNWIEFVIGDKNLASGVAKTKSKKILLGKTGRRISQLKSLSRKK